MKAFCPDCGMHVPVAVALHAVDEELLGAAAQRIVPVQSVVELAYSSPAVAASLKTLKVQERIGQAGTR